ncbi:Reverse transcriptase [Phytophthora palmivora]|uniref:Reverse transcriptase n=1 Tax=Phytophthora palmivora TaxID=4796 RepID=A0A2P4XY89_9STRA|nr:Reverse transcriptase [Phytophthora palmivora]
MNKVEYLGHRVSKDGLGANPKDLEALTDLAFPGSLRSMQYFLGSLNYYSRFIEDYAIYAAVLYELREVDFAVMSKDGVRVQIKRSMEHKKSDQLDLKEDPGSDLTLKPMETSDPRRLDGDKVDLRWIRAHRAFETLKSKITSTPILRHFDADQEAVVIVYANDWAISAALVQEYDQIYYPITFVSRTLKSNELNYSPVEKEVLALRRILDLGYNMLVGRRIRVLTRYSMLAWLFRSTGLQERLGQWAALLSPWMLEIVKCVKGEEEILGVIAASITPSALIQISPKKEPRRKIQAPIPVIQADEELYVVSFDGSARVKRGGGAYSAILWKLPEWTVIQARSAYAEDLTVNEAEFHGLLLCLDLLSTVDRKRVVFCGDSNLVIRQVRGEIDCKAPGLTLLKQRALDRLKDWPDHELVHVKRDWNGSADSLASAALQRQGGVEIESDEDKQDLITLNRLGEVLVAKKADQAAQITAVVTRSGSRSTARTTSDPHSLREEVVQDLRIDRIRQAQDEEAWFSGLKKYLNGDLRDLTQQEAKSYVNLAVDYDLDHHDLLFYCPSTRPTDADRDKLMRLVIPETLYQDILHHYHVSLEGGHQGSGRTYQQIRDHFHWRGLYKSVQRHVGECVDCETGKSKPRIQGGSPGYLQATYPFQIIAMDHIPSLPRSYKGNTELLIFEDLFSGYVIAKASSSRTAQTVAESYEECVFRRFGASEAIRHDREPGFMSDFFRAFNKILGQRQRATMAYRPQANGSAERMVQTTTRAIKMYVQDLDQRDWDEYAERITFAINTAHDRIRGETPFYMVRGWDPRSTLEAVIPVGSTRRYDRDPRRWRYQIQRYYQQVREQVNQRLREAISDRADLHNQEIRPHQIEVGSRVWLYLDRVGYAKKLAHLWHGPFRIVEKVGEHAVKLEIVGSGYRAFPMVHVNKLMLVKEYPDRPLMRLNVESQDRLDFDEDLLPGDSWIQDRDPDEYEILIVALCYMSFCEIARIVIDLV